MKEGIVLINKPGGMTSHDVVSCVRRKFKMRRVGHAGTLDPMATGVLVVLLGKATKLFNKFVGFDKGYRATLELGRKTDTADIEGKTIEQRRYEHITEKDLQEAFARFHGETQQTPPMVSAVKFKGQPLYKLARRGIEVDRESRTIRIDILELLDFSSPYVKFYIECSKGTYVRKLAEDIGEELGCGACISQIQRTRVGPFKLEDTVSLDALGENHIQDSKNIHESYIRN
jgi:tRNA pseudouridine55 synthase